MSIANRINEITKHLENDYTNIEALVGEVSVDKNIENIAPILDGLWETLPHTTGTGTDITLNGTKKGKAKVDLKGNTSQKTTTGKNLLNITLPNGTYNELTFTKISEGTYRISGTTTSWARSLILVDSAYNPTIEAGQNYTYSVEIISGTFGGSFPISIYNSDDTVRYNYFNVYESNKTQTQSVIQNNGVHQITFYIAPNTTTDFTFRLQLEKGNTKTDFEPYTNGASPNPSYPQPINVVSGDNEVVVCGKNLFDGEIELGSINPANGTLSSSTTRTRSTNFTKVKPNTTYTFTRTKGDYRWVVGYTSSKVGITDGNVDNQASALLKINSNAKSWAFTTSATTEYIKWYDTNCTDLSEKVMIEVGSTATSYEPYQSNSYSVNLGTIELCKIGTYQDYFYKDSGKWYKYGAIGKVVLDGSESYATWGLKETNYFSAYVYKTINNPAIINDTIISDHFPYSNYNVVANATNVGCFTGGTYIGISVPKNILSDTSTSTNAIASLKTWLTNNNSIFYYLLNTPTTTEITDSTLLEQLEAVYRANTYNTQTNFTQINNDLPLNLSVTALESEGE